MTKLEELKAAFEAATPGEWTAPGFNSQGGKVACLLDNPDGLRLVSGNFERADAKFIALAHNMMPTLLEAIDLLEDVAMGNSEYDDLSKRAAELLEKLK